MRRVAEIKSTAHTAAGGDVVGTTFDEISCTAGCLGRVYAPGRQGLG
jgi:hypothetical protein